MVEQKKRGQVVTSVRWFQPRDGRQDDDGALKAAIRRVEASGGGTVVLPPEMDLREAEPKP